MNETIRALFGAEPMRDDELPRAFIVGCDAVTKIERREENYGDHGLLWFDVYEGERRIASMNARFVAEIQYGSA